MELDLQEESSIGELQPRGVGKGMELDILAEVGGQGSVVAHEMLPAAVVLELSMGGSDGW